MANPINIQFPYNTWLRIAETLASVSNDIIDASLQTDEGDAEVKFLDDVVRDIRRACGLEPARKPHTRIDQKFYLEFIDEYGPQTIHDLALTFDVHEGTARRKLDGLLHQGKLEREWRSPWSSTIYWIPGKPPTG